MFNFVFYLTLSFIFPFIWVHYFSRKDKDREPFIWLFFALFLGIISGILSFYSERLFQDFYFKDKSNFFIFLAALIEEFFKFILIAIFIFPRKVFDEPIDAMIYMMFSALGFAFIENMLFLIRAKEHGIILVLILRFLSANLVHVLVSSLIGYGYALGMLMRRVLPFIITFVSATILHFIYNYLIINLRSGFLLNIPILWSIFMVVIIELNYLAGINGKQGRTKN